MRPQAKGLLVTFLGVALMSVEAPLIRLTQTPAITIGFYFGLFIMLSTQGILLSRGVEAWKKSFTTQPKGAVLAGMCMGFGNFFFIQAVSHGGIANTVLILASAPVVSALLALLILKERTPLHIYIAAVFVFLGLYVIVAEGFQGGTLKGNVYALLVVLCLSFLFIVLTFYKKTSRIAFVFFGGFFVSLLCGLGFSFAITWNGLFFVGLMGLVVTPFSRILIGMGTRYLIPAQMGLLIIAESILAPFWGWWWLGEIPTSTTLLGGGIILGAIGFNALATLRRP